MTSVTTTDLLTRDHILKLLSDGELSSVRSAETRTQLRNGDEYLDLEQLAQGVQRVTGAVTRLGDVLPRRAIHEDTWRRVLRQLKTAQVERQVP